MKQNANLKLKELNFKLDHRGVLCAIQLEFNTGYKSPMFVAEQVSDVGVQEHSLLWS